MDMVLNWKKSFEKESLILIARTFNIIGENLAFSSRYCINENTSSSFLEELYAAEEKLIWDIVRVVDNMSKNI